jgi:hypothetical protein
MLRRVALVRTDVSEKPSASFIRVTRIGELGTTQAATSKSLTAEQPRRHHSSCILLSILQYLLQLCPSENRADAMIVANNAQAIAVSCPWLKTGP